MKLGVAIQVRVLADDAKLIRKAARLEKIKVARFVREAAVRQARLRLGSVKSEGVAA